MRADICIVHTTFALRHSCNRLSEVFCIVRPVRCWNHLWSRSEISSSVRCGQLNRLTRSSFVVRNPEPSGLWLVMPNTPESLGRSSKIRRVSAERSQIRDRAGVHPAADLQESLAASLEQCSDSAELRWSARSSLFLILGVGTMFWGGVYLLFFA